MTQLGDSKLGPHLTTGSQVGAGGESSDPNLAKLWRAKLKARIQELEVQISSLQNRYSPKMLPPSRILVDTLISERQQSVQLAQLQTDNVELVGRIKYLQSFKVRSDKLSFPLLHAFLPLVSSSPLD